MTAAVLQTTKVGLPPDNITYTINHEGAREMNTLIGGRGATGLSAFA
jgi:hypothetical protein